MDTTNKNLLFLIILGLLVSAGCYTQNKYSEGISKVKGEQFQVSYTGLDHDRIVVYNLKGKRIKGGPISDNPNALTFSRDDIHFDIAAAKNIIQDVLKPKMGKLRKNKDSVHIILTFERLGSISDISYGLEKSTLISLEDIAYMDNRLRKSIKATYTGKVYQDYNFFIYSLGTIQF